MKSRKEFYDLFRREIIKYGFEPKPSESSDYLMDIYRKDRLVAFYTRGDHIIKNPFHDVSDNIIEKLGDKARQCALRAGICSFAPYDESNPKVEKLPDGSYKLSEYGGMVLAVKSHHLFD